MMCPGGTSPRRRRRSESGGEAERDKVCAVLVVRACSWRGVHRVELRARGGQFHVADLREELRRRCGVAPAAQRLALDRAGREPLVRAAQLSAGCQVFVLNEPSERRQGGGSGSESESEDSEEVMREERGASALESAARAARVRQRCLLAAPAGPALPASERAARRDNAWRECFVLSKRALAARGAHAPPSGVAGAPPQPYCHLARPLALCPVALRRFCAPWLACGRGIVTGGLLVGRRRGDGSLEASYVAEGVPVDAGAPEAERAAGERVAASAEAAAQAMGLDVVGCVLTAAERPGGAGAWAGAGAGEVDERALVRVAARMQNRFRHAGPAFATVVVFAAGPAATPWTFMVADRVAAAARDLDAQGEALPSGLAWPQCMVGAGAPVPLDRRGAESAPALLPVCPGRHCLNRHGLSFPHVAEERAVLFDALAAALPSRAGGRARLCALSRDLQFMLALTQALGAGAPRALGALVRDTDSADACERLVLSFLEYRRPKPHVARPRSASDEPQSRPWASAASLRRAEL